MIFSSLLVFLSNKALIEYLNSVLIYINDRINLFEIFYRLEERLGIFKEAIHLIYQNPIFGLGAGRINDIVINDKSYILHTHNLFYELAYNYGLLAATPIIITILLLFYKSFTNIYNLSITKQQAKLYKPISIIDKSWFVAFFTILISQLVDIQYFDGRISLLFWLILASIREILKCSEKELISTNT